LRLGGYGGGDIVPALLEPGEAVVPKNLVGSVAPILKAHGVPGFASGGVMTGDLVPSLITGGHTKAAAAAIAQDTRMLAKFFPAAAIPAPAALPPQFMSDYAAMVHPGMPGVPLGGSPVPAGGMTGGQAPVLTAEAPVHVHVKLDGREVWASEQKHTLRYNLRNNGVPTGLQKP